MITNVSSIILVISIVAISICCNDRDDNILDVPTCLLSTYSSFISDQADCNGAQVVAYAFQEEEVFVFVEGECVADSGIKIYSQDCVLICLLGGIAGLTQCDGVDFFEVAIQVRVIWKA